MSDSSSGGLVIAGVIFGIAQWGTYFDDNKAPIYGDTLGLPVNCRAYVQASIDEFRSGAFTAQAAMDGLERNCGLHGQAWKDNRKG